MAKRKMEYEITGKSDVEQVTRRAKASLSQMDQLAQTVSKKFSEIGKDLFMRFLAPVMLIDKGINMIADGIKKMTEDARDGIDGIKEGTDELYSDNILKAAARIKQIHAREKDSLQSQEEMTRLTKSIFSMTDVGREYLDELTKKHFLKKLFMPNFTHAMAQDPEVQMEASRRLAATLPEEKKVEAATFAAAQGGNVIGVGQSALDLAVGEQTQIQKEILQMLREHLPSAKEVAEGDLTNKPPPVPTYVHTTKRTMRIRMPGAR